MGPLLDWLYQSDIDLSYSKNYKRQRSAALDEVLRAEEAVKKELSPNQLALVMDYMEKVQLYHSLDGPFQFERGFLHGSRLIMEVLSKIWCSTF